jgi:hypothetical protein
MLNGDLEAWAASNAVPWDDVTKQRVLSGCLEASGPYGLGSVITDDVVGDALDSYGDRLLRESIRLVRVDVGPIEFLVFMGQGFSINIATIVTANRQSCRASGLEATVGLAARSCASNKGPPICLLILRVSGRIRLNFPVDEEAVKPFGLHEAGTSGDDRMGYRGVERKYSTHPLHCAFFALFSNSDIHPSQN